MRQFDYDQTEIYNVVGRQREKIVYLFFKIMKLETSTPHGHSYIAI